MARRLRTKCIFKNVHPQNSNHLRSHSRSITALDHSRLVLENKFSGKQIRPNFFAFDKFYFTKSCQQIWGWVNQLFIPFIHHIGGETVLFIIHTSDRMQYFTIFQDKLHSIHETVQKNLQNHLSGQSVLTFEKRQICGASCVEWFNDR